MHSALHAPTPKHVRIMNTIWHNTHVTYSLSHTVVDCCTRVARFVVHWSLFCLSPVVLADAHVTNRGLPTSATTLHTMARRARERNAHRYSVLTRTDTERCAPTWAYKKPTIGMQTFGLSRSSAWRCFRLRSRVPGIIPGSPHTLRDFTMTDLFVVTIMMSRSNILGKFLMVSNTWYII